MPGKAAQYLQLQAVLCCCVTPLQYQCSVTASCCFLGSGKHFMGQQGLRISWFLQVAGDDTTVIQAVLACDIERSQLLKEEQTLLRQLNKEAPDSAQPSQAATATGQPATANGDSPAPNGHPAPASDRAGLPNGSAATAAETRDNDGAVGGKEMASKAADAAESKAAAQLAQVHISCISTRSLHYPIK